MTQMNTEGPTVTVKAQPDLYTVLLLVAILVLGVSIGLVMSNLMAPAPDGYGLSFGALFDSQKLPEPIRPPAQ
jgi:hypothetical protein